MRRRTDADGRLAAGEAVTVTSDLVEAVCAELFGDGWRVEAWPSAAFMDAQRARVRRVLEAEARVRIRETMDARADAARALPTRFEPGDDP